VETSGQKGTVLRSVGALWGPDSPPSLCNMYMGLPLNIKFYVTLNLYVTGLRSSTFV